MKVLSKFKELYMNQKTPIVLLRGGRGSGKSVAAAQYLSYRSKVETGHRILVVRKTRRSHLKSTFDQIPQALTDLKTLWKPNKSDLTIQTNNGSEFVFEGLDKPDKLKSTTNVSMIWVEEALEVDRDNFESLMMLLRSSLPHKQIILSYNPDNSMHWLHDFEKEVDEDILLNISSIRDNPFAPEYLIRSLRDMNNVELQKSWLHGDWAQLGDVIFDNFVIKDLSDNKYLKQMHDDDMFVIGMDFGFTAPSAALLMYINLAEKRVYIIDEVYKSKLVNSEFMEEVKDLMYRNDVSPERVVMYGDEAEPDRILEFERKFTESLVFAAKKKVKRQIGVTKEFKLFIDPICENLIKEIKTWSYAKDRWGNPTDVPATGNDHACFVAGTQILTENGNKNIEDIKAGDMVITSKGNKLVLESGSTGINDVYEYNIFGTKVIATPDHPIILSSGIKEIDKLTNEDLDAIIYADYKKPDHVQTLVDKNYLGKRKTYNLKVKDTPEYYANGILFHNCDSLMYGILNWYERNNQKITIYEL